MCARDDSRRTEMNTVNDQVERRCSSRETGEDDRIDAPRVHTAHTYLLLRLTSADSEERSSEKIDRALLLLAYLVSKRKTKPTTVFSSPLSLSIYFFPRARTTLDHGRGDVKQRLQRPKTVRWLRLPKEREYDQNAI